MGDGLIGLGGLEVLGQVRVEVVLPGEAAGLGDLAPQCQADADGVLHPAGVDHGQSTGQATEVGVTIVLGCAPKMLGAASNILVAVPSSTCTSSPRTGS